LSVNTEYLRKSILVNEPAKVQTLSLDFIRSIAKKKGVFDDSKFNKFLQNNDEEIQNNLEKTDEKVENNEDLEQKNSENNKKIDEKVDNFDKKSEKNNEIPEEIIQEVEKIEEEKNDNSACEIFEEEILKEFIIPVPNTAHKLDLVEMKKYLQELEP
jgi:hypothetical protein